MTSVKSEQLIFGTMRLLESASNELELEKILLKLHTMNLRVLHVSDEYESYSLLCKTLKIIKDKNLNLDFNFMVKLGEPHFDSTEFSAERLKNRIAQYCLELNVDKIQVVQWMWRNSVDNDVKRLESFASALPDISEAVISLKESNLIDAFLCFPYSIPFAELAIKLDVIDGLAVYFNPLETDYSEVMREAKNRNKLVYSIRPFAASKLFNEGWTSRALIDYTFSNASIAKVIVTATKESHLEQLSECYS